jgi:hypothetical protein
MPTETSELLKDYFLRMGLALQPTNCLIGEPTMDMLRPVVA